MSVIADPFPVAGFLERVDMSFYELLRAAAIKVAQSLLPTTFI
jgi:hypothetical protein